MKTQAILAAVLFAGSFAAPAFAQQTIVGMTIPEEQMGIVGNHCEALAAAARLETGDAPEDGAAGQDDDEESPGAEGDGALTAGQGNAVGRTSVTELDDDTEYEEQDDGDLDIDAITLADCEEAGLAGAEDAAE
ncbi:MAG TPA: hypothetical protein VGN60_05230 [Devosia sp.]|jgi:hypothetical protein|nr:hypothetical protein [Devosia sp.]